MDILNDNDKYANALNRAKKELQKDNYEATNLAIKRIFPELNESTDKLIRDSLIRYFQEKKNCVGNTWAGMNVDDVLDWLKKQKPTEQYNDNIIDVLRLAVVNSGDLLFKKHNVTQEQCIEFINSLSNQVSIKEQKENTKKANASNEVLSKALIDELVKEKIESYPNYWRSGQKVFNALEEVLLKATEYERNIAREVQTIDKVDCYFDDCAIQEFLDKCSARYKDWVENNSSKKEK